MVNNKDVTMLLFALFGYYEKHGSYAPVDNEKMFTAIDTVINTGINGTSVEIPFNTLIILARLLSSQDGIIHDVLLNINGTLVKEI